MSFISVWEGDHESATKVHLFNVPITSKRVINLEFVEIDGNVQWNNI